MEELDSKYLIIYADSLEEANALLYQKTMAMGLSENNYLYLVGLRNEGEIGGIKITNKNEIRYDSFNGLVLYEFDKNIVAVLDEWITIMASSLPNVKWCTRDGLQAYLQSEVI